MFKYSPKKKVGGLDPTDPKYIYLGELPEILGHQERSHSSAFLSKKSMILFLFSYDFNWLKKWWPKRTVVKIFNHSLNEKNTIFFLERKAEEQDTPRTQIVRGEQFVHNGHIKLGMNGCHMYNA